MGSILFVLLCNVTANFIFVIRVDDVCGVGKCIHGRSVVGVSARTLK